ncbi:MAG: DNA polymerase (family 10) [Myxococcota bacterium]
MSDRRSVVRALHRLAWGYTVLGESDRKSRAYSRAADALDSITEDFAEAYNSGGLAMIPGVGASSLKVVDAVMAEETPAALSEVESRIPASLFDLRAVSGLGPKRIRTLWADLAVTSLMELAYACEENRLLALAGFGPKLQDRIALAVQKALHNSAYRRLDHATHAAADMLSIDSKAVVVGDLRRGCEVIQTVDIASRAAHPYGTLITVHGFTAWQFEVADVPVRWIHANPTPVTVWWLTGSDTHREAVVAHAERRGLQLTATGLFKDRQAVPIASEDDLYATLELIPVPPEQREGSVLHVTRPQLRLIRRSDLQGALHNHTVASDGSGTLEQMRAAAAERGLTYLGISDHSPTAHYANGLVEQRLTAQKAAIHALADGPCTLLTGVESDILPCGLPDHPMPLLRTLDVVIGSIHDRAKQDGDTLTARMVRATQWAHIIGHPTGRLLLGRPASEIDMDVLIAACAKTGCVLELNANPQRLDLNATHAAMAKEAGVLLSIAADAHSTTDLDNLDYGITIARRAGLSPDDVLNTRPLSELFATLRAL